MLRVPLFLTLFLSPSLPYPLPLSLSLSQNTSYDDYGKPTMRIALAKDKPKTIEYDSIINRKRTLRGPVGATNLSSYGVRSEMGDIGKSMRGTINYSSSYKLWV